MATGNWIILAWATPDFEVVPGMYRTDLGERPKLKEVQTPKAMVWCREGSDKELLKATAYAQANGYTVYQYPHSEREPLVKARKDILAPNK